MSTGANDTGTTELRDHVLGDIYHSQLIEVGNRRNVEFSSNNEEVISSINNYQAFKVHNKIEETSFMLTVVDTCF